LIRINNSASLKIKTILFRALRSKFTLLIWKYTNLEAFLLIVVRFIFLKKSKRKERIPRKRPERKQRYEQSHISNEEIFSSLCTLRDTVPVRTNRFGQTLGYKFGFCPNRRVNKYFGNIRQEWDFSCPCLRTKPVFHIYPHSDKTKVIFSIRTR